MRPTGRPTGRPTILQWTNNMGGWSVARSDSPSCLLKQAPGWRHRTQMKRGWVKWRFDGDARPVGIRGHFQGENITVFILIQSGDDVGEKK